MFVPAIVVMAMMVIVIMAFMLRMLVIVVVIMVVSMTVVMRFIGVLSQGVVFGKCFVMPVFVAAAVGAGFWFKGLLDELD